MQSLHSDRPSRLTKLKQYLLQDPNNVVLLADAVAAAVDEHKPQDARDLLDQLAAIEPLSPQLRNLAGLAALQQGDFEAAIATFSALDAANSQDPSLRFNLAWSLAMQKRFEEALALLDRPTTLAISGAAMLQVQLLHQLQRLEEAHEQALFHLERHPYDSGLNAAVSTLAMDLEDEALALKTAARGGDHPEAITTLATLALGEGEAQTALSLFDRALAESPALPRALIGKGLAELQMGRQAEAIEDLERGAGMFGTHLGAWIAAGWARLLSGDRAGARSRFEATLRLDRTFAETHGSLAVLEALEGDIAGAHKSANIALRLDSECFSARFAQVLLSAGAGEPAAAKAMFETMLATKLDASGLTLAQALTGLGRR